MDTIRLRTLTEKSILGFGKYYDLNVKYLLDMQRTIYLRWVYFNCSMISFVDDILDKIYVYPEYRIEKPGKNSELGKELDNVLSKVDYFKNLKRRSHNKVRQKAKHINFKKRDQLKYSKSNLQRLNHGH